MGTGGGPAARAAARYAPDFSVRLQPDLLDVPDGWRKGRRIFVCSMSDLFHEDVPDDFIHQVFATAGRNPRHTFQILTKRAERLAALAPSLPWSGNIWAGVTVESARHVHRIDLLRHVPAAVRWLSIEPMLGPMPGLDLDGIGWVIVGGESGRDFRPLDPAWVRDIRDQCSQRKIPFFFKQMAGVKPIKGLDCLLDGAVHKAFP
jgi:protein gp37